MGGQPSKEQQAKWRSQATNVTAECEAQVRKETAEIGAKQSREKREVGEIRKDLASLVNKQGQRLDELEQQLGADDAAGQAEQAGLGSRPSPGAGR